jgi:hypothetical protein
MNDIENTIVEVESLEENTVEETDCKCIDCKCNDHGCECDNEALIKRVEALEEVIFRKRPKN